MELKKMDLKGYEKYIVGTIKEYASEKVDAGTWRAEEAMELAEEEYRQLLPDGLETEGNYFYIFKVDQNNIGYLWLAKSKVNPEDSFIYDFAVEPEFQNKGFGTQAMGMIFIEARRLGFKKIGLHVFGSNERAIHVYHKLGFIPTDITMSRDL
ncbi:GNAT family N-acetyltransferase [Liquorilactobacillus mali]|uniref:GNAT family N-acetyltransferase n=1 Tax=Liquorilactobacillus mali TaxID=1618 RepID=UPI0026509E74|nr:GNAT family N-acetyltransferase [Liquorilactobacillus mali]MDN7145885.1 GNAT family N-acetyltransferase [Liquorilactobacillus mali]